MKAYSLQRATSFLIDYFIVALIVSLFTIFIPTSKEYDNAVAELPNLITEYSKMQDIDGLLDEFNTDSYIISKDGMIFTVVNVLVSLAYYGTFVFYNNGQTIGKKVMKIKIESLNGTLSHAKCLLRCSIINGCFSSVASMIVLFFISPNQYIYTAGLVSEIQSLLFIISSLMVLFRKDGRGLHDLLLNTRVVSV